MDKRCGFEGRYGTGCSRTTGHDGAHWLTGNPEAAHADLVRIGFFQPEWVRRARANALPLRDETNLRGYSQADTREITTR